MQRTLSAYVVENVSRSSGGCNYLETLKPVISSSSWYQCSFTKLRYYYADYNKFLKNTSFTQVDSTSSMSPTAWTPNSLAASLRMATSMMLSVSTTMDLMSTTKDEKSVSATMRTLSQSLMSPRRQIWRWSQRLDTLDTNTPTRSVKYLKVFSAIQLRQVHAFIVCSYDWLNQLWPPYHGIEESIAGFQFCLKNWKKLNFLDHHLSSQTQKI